MTNSMSTRKRQALLSLLESAPCRIECESPSRARNLRWDLYHARKGDPAAQRWSFRIEGSTLFIDSIDRPANLGILSVKAS